MLRRVTIAVAAWFFVSIAAIGAVVIGQPTPSYAQTNQQKQIILFGSCPGTIRLAGAPCPAVNLNFATGRAWVQGQGYVPFTNLLSISRASTGYATTSSGLLVPFAANTLRITDLGLLVEQSSTNLALWSRDFTNAAWVKVNVTAALTATGADGIANSASLLTATANAGTVLQTVTLASAQRTLSFYVQRVSGTGAVSISQDGISWTAITGSINSAGYTKVTLTATQLNPVIGFQFATSGDAVNVDFAGLEALVFATSPIPTTTTSVLRNADIPQLIGPAVTAALNAESAFFQTSGVGGVAAGTYNALLFYSSGQRVRSTSSTVVNQFSTAGSVGSNAFTGNWTGTEKIAFNFDAASVTLRVNANVIATGAYNGTVGVGGTPYLGNGSAGTTALNGYMQRFALSPVKGVFDGATAP